MLAWVVDVCLCLLVCLYVGVCCVLLCVVVGVCVLLVYVVVCCIVLGVARCLMFVGWLVLFADSLVLHLVVLVSCCMLLVIVCCCSGSLLCVA